MKGLFLVSLIFFIFGKINGQQSSPLIEDHQSVCYRIDNNMVNCELTGIDRNLNLNDNEVLDSLFIEGQNAPEENYVFDINQGLRYSKGNFFRNQAKNRKVEKVVIVKNRQGKYGLNSDMPL